MKDIKKQFEDWYSTIGSKLNPFDDNGLKLAMELAYLAGRLDENKVTRESLREISNHSGI